MTCQVLKRRSGPDLAYEFTPGVETAPVILFLSGYRGDRQGTKAMALRAHLAHTPYGSMQFDYRGHGESAGDFDSSTLTDWLQDARDILALIPPARSVVIMGSSMGGWLGLRLVIEDSKRIAGFIGLAAAPDFTVTMVQNLSAAQQQELDQTGQITLPSHTPGYEPYWLTRSFLNDGVRLAILSSQHETTVPLVFIHGEQDRVVSTTILQAIRGAFPRASLTVQIIQGADHSLARPQDLAVIYQAINDLATIISA